MVTPIDPHRTLQALGAQLETAGATAGIVILGGAALNLLGIVDRATQDVDVVAFSTGTVEGRPHLVAPHPWPAALTAAVQTVARDFGLPSDWLNTVAAGFWETGLPDGLEDRLEWRTYGALSVGIVGRIDLIYFKLYAAADDLGPSSVHFQDLVALNPGPGELKAAARWIATQDPSPVMSDAVTAVISHVDARRR
jgi:hypothetical protein